MNILEKSDFIEIGDNTEHPISHAQKVGLSKQDGRMCGKVKLIWIVYLMYPTLPKNWVSIVQMIAQTLQVYFNPNDYYWT